MGQHGSRIVANFTTEETQEACVKKCEGKRPQSVIDASKSATQVTQAPAQSSPATQAVTLPPGSSGQGGGARKRKIYKKKKSRKSRKYRKSSKKKRRTK